MMQQVNLLTDELRPQQQPLPPRQLLLTWGGLSLLLLAVSGWQALGLWRLAHSHEDRQLELASVSAANAELRAGTRTVPAQALVTEVDALRERYRAETLLVDAVKGYQRRGGDGFSRYLNDLAAQHVDGMALERIDLQDGGSHIALSGETDAPVNVPVFLKRLSDGRSFRGHRFDEFKLEAQDSGLLRFDIKGPTPERSG